MAAAAITAAAAAATASATESSSYSSSTTYSTTALATGIIAAIVIVCSLLAFLVGFIWFCIRRRRRQRKQAALLATAKQNVENARLSQQRLLQQQQGNGMYQIPSHHRHPSNDYMTEMPAYPFPSDHLLAEKDGQVRHEVYSPPASVEMYTPPPPSNELDGSYGCLPAGPNSDASSPMLRKEHEQAYSRSWNKNAGGAT